MKILNRALLVLGLSLSLVAPGWALEDHREYLLQNAVEATDDGRAISVDGFTAVGLDITIADTATVTFEGSVSGSGWTAVTCASSGSTSAALVTSASASGIYQCNVAGLGTFRARISAWSLGTVSVFARATTAVATKGGGGGAGGGAGTEYDEDSGHTSTSPGTFVLNVRSDAGGALCGADGDYCPFQTDSNGALRVTGGGGGTEYNTNDPAPTNPVGTSTLVERTDTLGSPGTEAVGDWTNLRGNANGALWVIDANSAAALTALQLIDNVVFAEDSAHTSTDAGIPSLCVRHDIATTGLGVDGDYANCGISAAGRLYVDALISDGAGALNVIVDSGTLTAVTTITNPVTITDGAGALNTIVDSGTITAVTTITNPVTVTDGAGALNVIVDSGTITVTDGAGALNVIVDSGTITTVSTVTSVSSVAAVIPGTGATNLGKAEDSPHTSGDVGVGMLCVRHDVATTGLGVDGDYANCVLDANGALVVTGGGGGTEYSEDAATPATIVGTATMMERDDALATVTPIEGDWISLRGTSIGSLWVRDDNGNAIQVAAGASDRGVPSLAIRDDALSTLTPADGAYTNLRVDSVGSLHVTIDSIAAVAGTTTVTEDGSIPADATAVTEVAAVLYCDNGTNPVHCAYTTSGGLNTSVAAVIAGTGATNLGKAVDSVAGATDTGVAMLAVRDDALGALTPIEGDYVHLRVNSTGALHVTGGGGGTQYNIGDVASATATGTFALAIRNDTLGTLADPDGDVVGLRVNSQGALHVTGGGGGTEYVVNAAAPADPTGATFTMERDDALSTLTEIEGDWTNPRSTAEGALWTQDFNSDAILAALTTVAGAVAGTEMQVDVLTLPSVTIGTFPDNEPFNVAQINGVTPLMGNGITGTGSQRVTIASDNTAFTVNVGTFPDNEPFNVAQINGVAVTMGNGISGTGVQRVTLASDSTGQVAVASFPDNEPFNVAQINGVTPLMGNGATGTGALRVSIANDSTGIVAANGTVAHDAADAGAPVKMGGKAVAHGSNPTGVAAADRTDWYFNRAGIPFMIGGHPNSITISAQIQDVDGALTDQALVSVAGGSKIAVTRLTASCDGSTTAPTNIKVGFGAATLPASAHTGVAGILHEFDGVPAGGGFTIGDGSGLLGIGADGEDLRYTIEDPAGGNCSISVSYFTVES